MKSNRVERLFTLIHALESGRLQTADDLAGLAGVSKRTVFRDLDLLTRAGIRYNYDRQTHRYSASSTTLRPPVALSHAESLALLLAARQMSSKASLPNAEAAASASLKLESMLPAAIRDYCSPLLNRLDYRNDPASDVNPIADTLAALQAAMIKPQKVAVTYDSYAEGKAISTVLHPYRLAYIHRGWYLIAFDEQASQVQTYKVERILHLNPLDSAYRIDPGFNLDDYFGNAWLMIRDDKRYHVTLRFLKQVAANVDEVAWHKTQRTTYKDDGSLLFEVDVDGIREIAWWILGYGDQVQVLEPPELRKLISRRVARMYSYYHGRNGHVGQDGA